jgi:hypothetical protein
MDSLRTSSEASMDLVSVFVQEAKAKVPRAIALKSFKELFIRNGFVARRREQTHCV